MLYCYICILFEYYTYVLYVPYIRLFCFIYFHLHLYFNCIQLPDMSVVSQLLHLCFCMLHYVWNEPLYDILTYRDVLSYSLFRFSILIYEMRSYIKMWCLQYKSLFSTFCNPINRSRCILEIWINEERQSYSPRIS